MQNLSNQKSVSKKRTFLSTNYFLSKGCKQVPPDFIGGKILWAHPDGYFLNAQGQKLAHAFSPSRLKRAKSSTCKMGKGYPSMRNFGAKDCHTLMALAFYGERPTFTKSSPLRGDGRGVPYPCVCHHLIPDALNYRPANLLCWLTRPEHGEADRRQRALRKVLTDLSVLGYDHLRKLQDPRAMSPETFNVELQKLTDIYAKENIS